MARGWISLHPFQEERLKALGINGNQITQGVATTDGDLDHASRGSHDSVGVKSGRRVGHCVDISVSYMPNRAHFNALAQAGFAPFYRDWSGNAHWHIVDVAWIKDDNGIVPRHLSIPRGQVQDFLSVPPRNGLVGHAILPTAWRPTAAQQSYLRLLWTQGIMPTGYDTADPGPKVIYPANAGAAGIVPCRPELVSGKLRGDLAEFADALGFVVEWNTAQQKGYVKPKEA